MLIPFLNVVGLAIAYNEAANAPYRGNGKIAGKAWRMIVVTVFYSLPAVCSEALCKTGT